MLFGSITIFFLFMGLLAVDSCPVAYDSCTVAYHSICMQNEGKKGQLTQSMSPDCFMSCSNNAVRLALLMLDSLCSTQFLSLQTSALADTGDESEESPASGATPAAPSRASRQAHLAANELETAADDFPMQSPYEQLNATQGNERPNNQN